MIAVLVALLAGAVYGVLGARLLPDRLAALGGAAPPTPTAVPTAPTTPSSPSSPAEVRSAPPATREADTVRIAEQLLPSTVTIEVSSDDGQSLGSGFVIDREGRIMTNSHVVAGADRGGSIEVVLGDGRELKAELLGRSASYDLAVIRVEDSDGLRPVRLGDSDATRIGEPAVAIGSPLGLGGTVTEGIISAIDRPVSVGSADSPDGPAYLNALQTDAPINRGNSGGPLVNAAGEVIGVNSAILTGSGSQGESGNIGIGFAIPINQAREIGEMLIEDGYATYPVINATVAGARNLDGVRLTTVEPGGAADEAGLRDGDVVVSVDGKRVRQAEDLIVSIRNHRPGDTVRLDYRRDGDERTAVVTLGSKRG